MVSTLPQSLTIRPATLDDVEAVADLIDACALERTGQPRAAAGQLRSGEEPR